MSKEPGSYRRQATAEAARWFVTMQQQRVPESQRAAFAQWLSQSAIHVQEYLAVASAWRLSGEAGDQYASADLIRDAKADLARTETVVPLASDAHPVVRKRARGAALKAFIFESRFVLASALAVVVAIALTWTLLPPESVEYRTRAAEQLTAMLPDGSTVRLNTRTHVRVRLSAEFRDVELLEGEALFTVAKDKRRPFRVRSVGNEIRAVGTAFNVYRRDDVTTVTVLEGQVDVAPVALVQGRAARGESTNGSASAHVVRLTPAQQAQVAPDGRLMVTRTVDVREVTAWTHPTLRFSDEPLRDVIAQFNRYNATRLELDDADLGAVRVSGVFSAGDIDSFLAYLDQVEHVTIVRKDGSTRVLSRATAVVEN